VLHLLIRARFKGGHIVQERRRKEHVAIDVQIICVGELDRQIVVALGVLPAPCGMDERRLSQMIDAHLPRCVERNTRGAHRRLGRN
jgi:hypothetical protein